MSASDIADRISAESKAQAATRQVEEPTVYPNAEFYISHFVVEDRCPKCHDVSGSDLGAMSCDDIPETVEFWCDVCDFEWSKKFGIVVEVS